MAVLFVEFGELIQVVVADAIAAFDRVEFLSARAKVETLGDKVSICGLCDNFQSSKQNVPLY